MKSIVDFINEGLFSKKNKEYTVRIDIVPWYDVHQWFPGMVEYEDIQEIVTNLKTIVADITKIKPEIHKEGKYDYSGIGVTFKTKEINDNLINNWWKNICKDVKNNFKNYSIDIFEKSPRTIKVKYYEAHNLLYYVDLEFVSFK